MLHYCDSNRATVYVLAYDYIHNAHTGAGLQPLISFWLVKQIANAVGI